MKRFSEKALVVATCALTLALALVLAGCASQGSSGGSGGDSGQGTSSGGDSGQGTSGGTSDSGQGTSGGTSDSGQGTSGGTSDSGQDIEYVLDGDICVMVPLDYNAGTGYEWNCTIEPEGVMSIGTQETVDLAENQLIDGGPLQDVVTLWAVAPGTATLTCTLERSWEEGEPAETQTYVFEVDNSLQIDFLADESDYQNEPEIVSGS